ncbi:MAG: hypothetical protein RM347_004905 [Nostoc sp. ChiQUE02]|uniref:hypothetical protein n=1 Tax=Nostoc sp. ChiQUE02 TaxID=3075377 RepID=UPI002AD24913|nr:hypothetical protein [Nostoc sp. ChiQUE02]MDZ8234674.1 hypothetical protein [Nostoc sp. ChiQUE02]
MSDCVRRRRSRRVPEGLVVRHRPNSTGKIGKTQGESTFRTPPNKARLIDKVEVVIIPSTPIAGG